MSDHSQTQCPQQVVVLANPKSGSAARPALQASLGRCINADSTCLEIIDLEPGVEIRDLVKDRAGAGADLVVAAGGDGTVSAVGDALVGTKSALGIIPLGTANVLAQELGIPLNVDAAAQLLGGAHRVREIDSMVVNGRNYFTQVGVGLDALMIRDTGTEGKNRFGKLAYVWTALTRLAGMQPLSITLTIDGRSIKTSASQVIVANAGLLGQYPFRYGPDIKIDDGRLNICVSKARTIIHYASMFWHVLIARHASEPNIRYYEAAETITITPRRSLPVQADGEIIGETPVTIAMAHRALRVVVPETFGSG